MEEKNMHYYWKKQPDILRNILDSRKELTEEFVKLFSEVRPDKIYMVGSGTSMNAENTAAPFMEEILQIDVHVVPSSCIPQIRGKRPMIVFLSQGGSSTNTLEAMAALASYPSLCITGEKDCEIQRRSEHHMLIGCGEELVGPKTVGYTSSVINFYLCSLEAGLACGTITEQKYADKIKILQQAVENISENILRTDKWFEKNAADLAEVKKYVLVGHNTSAITYVEGCLKILETIKVPAMSFEFEEYLHGPIIVTDQDLGGIFFLPEEHGCKERMAELAKCHEQFSKYAYVVTSDEKIIGDKVLHLVTTGHTETEVFEAILLPQLISAKVPAILGLIDGSIVYDAYTQKCPTKYNNGR